MIFEPDIIDSDDGNVTTCMRALNGGVVWRITRSGFMPESEEMYAESTTRATIDQGKLLRFSYHRGAAKVLGVTLNSKDLQSFVEHLEGGDLDVRVCGDRRGLAIRQRETGMAIIGGVEFVKPEVAETFTIKHGGDTLPQQYHRRQFEGASNLPEFAEWVESVANGPAKPPHTLDFDNVDAILDRNPKFGAPVWTQWFDDQGYGPNIVEVMIDGWDAVGSDGARKINRRVGISLPDTIIKGGGSFNLQTLTALIENLQAAKAWMLAGMAVEGCTCGECQTFEPERRCASAAAVTHQHFGEAAPCASSD